MQRSRRLFIGIDLLDKLTSLTVLPALAGGRVRPAEDRRRCDHAGIILLLDRSIKPGDVIVSPKGRRLGQQDRRARGQRPPATAGASDPERGSDDQAGRENWSTTATCRSHPGDGPYDCDLPLAQELMLRATAESRACSTCRNQRLADQVRRDRDRARNTRLDQRSAAGSAMSLRRAQPSLAAVPRQWDGAPYPRRDVHLVGGQRSTDRKLVLHCRIVALMA